MFEVQVQIASLCLKSSNAVILKGGKEALRSNAILVTLMRTALASVGVLTAPLHALRPLQTCVYICAGLPLDAIQLVETREAVAELLSMDKYIDVRFSFPSLSRAPCCRQL